MPQIANGLNIGEEAPSGAMPLLEDISATVGVTLASDKDAIQCLG